MNIKQTILFLCKTEEDREDFIQFFLDPVVTWGPEDYYNIDLIIQELTNKVEWIEGGRVIHRAALATSIEEAISIIHHLLDCGAMKIRERVKIQIAATEQFISILRNKELRV